MGHLNSRLSGYTSSSNGSALAGSAGLLPCFTDFGLRAMVSILENHLRAER